MSTVATTTETLSKLWEELAAPSASAFLKALRSRGISARETDVRRFVSSKSERQILQPGVRYTGKTASFYQHDRWAADLINYTSRPATNAAGITMTQALLIQDLFTRFVWVRPMASVKERTQIFADVIKESKRSPRSLTTDKGVELTANNSRRCAPSTIST